MAKRFVWRLETVLNVRRRTEEQRQQELAQAMARLNAEQAERERVHDLQTLCRQDLKQRRTGRLNLTDLTHINAYLSALDRQHRRVEKRIADAQQAVAKKRTALTQAVRDRQILENLKARDYQVFRKEARRRDQAMMDEVAARKAEQTEE